MLIKEHIVVFDDEDIFVILAVISKIFVHLMGIVGVKIVER